MVKHDTRGIKLGGAMAVHNPCALLARLLEEPHEREWLEFKVNNDDPTSIGEYVSALANAAILSDRERAYLVFGVQDGTKEKVGTTVRLLQKKKGNEGFQNWLTRRRKDCFEGDAQSGVAD